MNRSLFHSSAALLLVCHAQLASAEGATSTPASPAVAQVSAPPAVPSWIARRQARLIAPNETISLKNPSFNPDGHGKIIGWTGIEHGAGNAYTFVSDPENALSPPGSARIKRHGSEPFAVLQQSILVHPSWHNKTVRLSGSLRGENISEAGGALTLRANDGSGQILASNFMQNARIKGNQNWKNFTIDLKIPPASYSLFVGIMLEGGGTLWADDLSIELIN